MIYWIVESLRGSPTTGGIPCFYPIFLNKTIPVIHLSAQSRKKSVFNPASSTQAAGWCYAGVYGQFHRRLRRTAKHLSSIGFAECHRTEIVPFAALSRRERFADPDFGGVRGDGIGQNFVLETRHHVG